MKIDISVGLFRQIQEAKRAANRAQALGEYGQAAKQWRICHRLMQQYAEYSSGDTVRRLRLEEAESYLAKAVQAEERAKQSHVPVSVPVVSDHAPASDYHVIAEGLITQVDVGWDDIGGLDDIKADIQTNYALGLVQVPPGVRIRPNRNLLLYGPPGTGKTMLAGAISRELDATFFNARIPDLLSQYFGESSKILGALYETAATHAPSVVFLDEVDALSRQRGGSQESGAERRLLNTFLNELDGLRHKGDDVPLVLTIGATNLPWELDRAIISRFSGGRIYVPLPNDAARHRILDMYVRGRGHTSAVSQDQLVRRTQGYSGREVERIVSLAVQKMLRRGNPELLLQVAGGQDALRKYHLRVQPLLAEDFDEALAQVKPSTSPADVRRYESWNEG